MILEGFSKRFGKGNPFFDSDLFDNYTFDKVFEDLDRFFGSCCYIDEDKNGVYQIEVPGFNKDNLTVELAEGILTIKGDRKVKDKNYAGNSKMYKRLSVADAEDVKAEIKDGILILTIIHPDKTPQHPGKQIVVR